MYHLNDIFYSLQGEGYNTGRPAVFVRFSGCNLHCPFCDTYFTTRTDYTLTDLLAALTALRSDCVSGLTAQRSLIVLTGGEPSLQVDEPLINALHKAGFEIAIETNGTHTLPEGIDWITCSPKEGSKVVLNKVNELKVVYTGQDVERYYNSIPASVCYLQPCTQHDGSTNVADVIDYIKAHPHWRLSLQTHKIIGFK